MSITQILATFRPGKTVYIPGATGEIHALIAALQDTPDRAEGVHFVSCLVPGMNEFDYASLTQRTMLTTYMLPRAMQASFAAGRVDILPRLYSAVVDCLAAIQFDVAIAHVAPPGPDGMCSYGIASDFGPLVWPKAAFRIALLNPNMPAMARGPRLNLSDADLVVDAESNLVTITPLPSNAISVQMAQQVAALIPDGAHLQTGIGGAPGALWEQLLDHKNLVLRSGMANSWLRDLREAGALDPDGCHTAGIAYGSQDFYDYLSDTDLVDFVTTVESHGIKALSTVPKLHSVNSALEIDLFGQVNVEWQNGRMASGVGGGPDFMRAANLSPGGRSIIALPASAKKGAVSRIVPKITAPSVGIARCDIDTVVTEHGVAELRTASMDARAQALIAIADPAVHDALEESWRTMRASF